MCFHLVAKSSARLTETFFDVWSFSMADWTGHPQLASALVQANKQHLPGYSAANALHQSVNQFLPDLRQLLPLAHVIGDKLGAA